MMLPLLMPLLLTTIDIYFLPLDFFRDAMLFHAALLR